MIYSKLNNIIGWITWAIATYVFCSTVEPTASFWDCGEFIATAYKLEVGHPPGAPLFMMIGRFFTLFGDSTTAAYAINILSALCSSFTILFLFWTITMLGKKMALGKGETELTAAKMWAVLGSGLVGGLAYTFSDSFWFSAVEGEVYAMSSLFTGLVFWAMLKWEVVAHEKYANKWLILIAYFMGLSIGVHLLNLLTLPAMCFVYYFKKYPVTRNGIIKTGIASIAILGVIQGGIIPWTVKLATYFELFFVNDMGMPFNTGSVIYLCLLVGGLVWGLYYTTKIGNVVANTAILCVTVILIGYSSFGLILVRSSANPPMDENNPENVFTLLSYLNREQYGDRPLAHGHYFNSPLSNERNDKGESLAYLDGNPVYFKDKKKGKYVISDEKKNSVPNYASEFKSLFPRMYSSDSRHVKAYKKWSNFEGRPIRYGDKTILKPTFSENLTYFVRYQLDWMYWRYFMWNFAGKQNDIQGHGGKADGNWLTGIEAYDSFRLGPQDELPSSVLENPARNTFFALPFLLGLLGVIYQFKKSSNDGLIVLLLFFFTGIAICIYLNQYPYQPRERDYAYAASFYAFAIWIGLGVFAIIDMLSQKKESVMISGAISLICLGAVPAVMGIQGWDDHDRSNTYTARDFAKDYLDSCQPNAILFTNGDNDTFPLWYVQEVEGYRTDVRVVNLSLLNTDWYIDQMRRKAYDSDPVPFAMTQDEYRQGTRDYLPVIDKNTKKQYVDVKDIMDFITNPTNAATFSGGRKLNYYPTKLFSLKVNKEEVLANGTVPTGREADVVDQLEWKINKNYIMKNDMMILDLLAHNNWERPVYFAITTGEDSYIGLQSYFQLEGLAYHLVPFKAESHDGQTGQVNTDIMYENLIEKFAWGGMESDHIYMNENNRRMCMNLRNNFARLADALVKEGKKEKAVKVLDRCLEVMPEHNVPFNFFMLPLAETYYKAGAMDKANVLVKRLVDIYDEDLRYYFKLKGEDYGPFSKQAQQGISVMYRLSMLAGKQYKQEELGTEISSKFEELQAMYGAKEQEKKSTQK